MQRSLRSRGIFCGAVSERLVNQENISFYTQKDLDGGTDEHPGGVEAEDPMCEDSPDICLGSLEEVHTMSADMDRQRVKEEI